MSLHLLSAKIFIAIVVLITCFSGKALAKEPSGEGFVMKKIEIPSPSNENLYLKFKKEIESAGKSSLSEDVELAQEAQGAIEAVLDAEIEKESVAEVKKAKEIIEIKFDKIYNAQKEPFFKITTDNNSSLSDETVSVLEAIPADGIALSKRVVKVKEAINIQRINAANPFAASENAQDEPGIRKGISLTIEVKEKVQSVEEQLSQAYEALSSGLNEAAAIYYKRILSENPDDERALFGLAVSYQKSDQIEQARDIYIGLISRDQNNVPALNNFLILASEESPEDAVVYLKELQKSNIEYAPIPAQLGALYAKANNLPLSARSYKRAILLAPENLSYRYNLAVIMERANSYENAASLYKQLLFAGMRGVNLPRPKNVIKNRLNTVMAKMANKG